MIEQSLQLLVWQKMNDFESSPNDLFCRPTHLLESHVSGQMVKREVTEEGEVKLNCIEVKLLSFDVNSFSYVIWKEGKMI